MAADKRMKSTEELVHQIKSLEPADVRKLGEKDYTCPSITVYVNDLLIEHRMEKKEVIRRLRLDRSYGYQILNGTRKPSRNQLIRLAVLLHLSLEETNRLLKIGRKEILYPRIAEDAVAILALEKKLSLEEYEELLEEAF